ncbi:transmembrane prolyl 4-hydroxylase-like [Orbicella faveolata]|uniref:transmembrane prolyl 4-hydroxylase-like n=1 Tax=Orbicella faveolata TaxID=48498 RepID=UPI0009E2AC0A|nr:transmembrane prolyl 4-hydroxylase-like [Orbicella faveolata]
MEKWRYFAVFGLVLLYCLLEVSSEELDKTKWTPKLREPVKIGHEEEVVMFPFHKRKVKTISMKPPIFEISNFLTDVECDHLISYAKRLGLEKSPLAKANETIDDETSERTFKIWDNNGDGFIEPVEIMHVRGKEDLYFTEDDLLEMFKDLNMDKDDNGKIDFEEFSKVTVPVMKDYFDKVRRTKPRLRSRNSRQVWMFHNDPKYPILSDFHGRLSRLSLLPEEFIKSTEPLQVVKYDVHGHYHCHHDSDELQKDLPCCSFSKDEDCRLCRLATVLLYLNEPEKGGETAFPLADNETFSTEAWEKGEGWKCNLAQNCHKSNLVVKPEKGKAIMWYNHFLDKNTGWFGELDQLSQHGGCDVLEGTKWVANLWLTLVGEPGTDEAFKGWIDYGKDESKYKLGTNWRGEAIKTGEETKETQENQEGAATKTDEETRKEKEKTLMEAKESGDGSYDVKLEL